MGHLQNGDFAYNADTARFVDKMVREHGFEPQQLHDVLAQTKKLDFVIRLMDKGVVSENGIYGHSRFCNTDFDDKLACLNLSGV